MSGRVPHVFAYCYSALGSDVIVHEYLAHSKVSENFSDWEPSWNIQEYGVNVDFGVVLFENFSEFLTGQLDVTSIAFFNNQILNPKRRLIDDQNPASIIGDTLQLLDSQDVDLDIYLLVHLLQRLNDSELLQLGVEVLVGLDLRYFSS